MRDIAAQLPVFFQELSVQQISGLYHATVAVWFAPWREAAVSATVAPAALDRAQRPLHRQSERWPPRRPGTTHRRSR
jgi:hypothetical protein